MPGGRIETGKTELVTRTKAEFQSAAEMDEMILRQNGEDIVRLKDVGFTEDGLEESGRTASTRTSRGWLCKSGGSRGRTRCRWRMT